MENMPRPNETGQKPDARRWQDTHSLRAASDVSRHAKLRLNFEE
jgi:hypothetical protein